MIPRKKLAIIGNGFDKAHGYKTSYPEFRESIDDHEFAFLVQQLETFCPDIILWTDLEQSIHKLVTKINQDYMIDPAESDTEEYNKLLEKINDEFESLSCRLLHYLKEETESRYLPVKASLQEELDATTVAINFNYTRTAESYLKDVRYVHGSVEENLIVLGFDGLQQNCIGGLLEAFWQKDLLRDLLSLKRSLIDSNTSYEPIKKEIFRLMELKESNKGIDECDITNSINGRLFQEHFMNSEKLIGLGIAYDDIEEIVSVGHGLVADQRFLESIFENLLNIKKITVFYYNGEKQDERTAKLDFYKKNFPSSLVVEKEY